ncbi:MAG: hypothetical protein KY469_08910 [Actinobacteria bacterium]|nr:hypothetical protein [Actinomycetota bacterium]
MEQRTLRAAAMADFTTFVLIGGSLWFLGMSPGLALLIGVVLGGLAFLLVWGVARRSERLHGPAAGPATAATPHPDPTSDPPIDEDTRG